MAQAAQETAYGCRPDQIRPFAPDAFEALDAIRRAAFVPVFHSFREIAEEQIGAASKTLLRRTFEAPHRFSFLLKTL